MFFVIIIIKITIITIIIIIKTIIIINGIFFCHTRKTSFWRPEKTWPSGPNWGEGGLTNSGNARYPLQNIFRILLANQNEPVIYFFCFFLLSIGRLKDTCEWSLLQKYEQPKWQSPMTANIRGFLGNLSGVIVAFVGFKKRMIGRKRNRTWQTLHGI